MVCHFGVGFKVFVGFGERGGHQVAILAHIGEVKGERAALTDAVISGESEEVAGAAQFEVNFGNFEAVV